MASSPGGVLGSGCVIIMENGAGHPHPNTVEFIFIISLFVPLILFPYLSGYRTSLEEEGLELTLAISQYMNIDPGVLALM